MEEKKGIYLVVDTEATGLHPGLNGLLEIAALALDENFEIIDTFQCDVRPPDNVEFDPVAMKVNGITEQRVLNGVNYEEVSEMFLNFIRSNFKKKPIAVGQFYPFDYAFLDHVFTVSGYGRLMADEVMGNSFIDTKSLVLTLNALAQKNGKKKPFKSTSLSKPGGLADQLAVSDYQAHTALGDVMATREVLIKLLELMPDLVAELK